jgi:hypothetical protein
MTEGDFKFEDSILQTEGILTSNSLELSPRRCTIFGFPGFTSTGPSKRKIIFSQPGEASERVFRRY